MNKMRILGGDWDLGYLNLRDMPKEFVLSARKLVILEECEYDRLTDEISQLKAKIKSKDEVCAKLYECLGAESYRFREQKQINKELQAELKAKDEAHKNEIFKMNDICVSLCRTKDEAIGLLNSMILSGEKHSDKSRKIVEDALEGS